jgi:hypothetical protein
MYKCVRVVSDHVCVLGYLVVMYMCVKVVSSHVHVC